VALVLTTSQRRQQELLGNAQEYSNALVPLGWPGEVDLVCQHGQGGRSVFQMEVSYVNA
jgi:hypothetical protein